MYQRHLRINLKKKQSAFLWGARKTGKSTYLKKLFPNSIRFDFLDTKLLVKYSKEPWKLREEILYFDEKKIKSPFILDEVQKIPAIMDEIHWLIENTNYSFILCGSSTRNMRKTGVNLLGGRALKYNFYPLAYPEIKEDFDIIRIFNNGLIPSHYASQNPKHILNSYIEDYLSNEIRSESMVRNLSAFSRFLSSLPFSHGEMINYSNIARDVGIDANTVKSYYQILEDTLTGYFLYPYTKKASRRIISSNPKFYLFDVGVAGRLMGRNIEDTRGIEAGRALEHYIFMELNAYLGLNLLDYKLNYWRTHNGLEVDFIANMIGRDPIPIEVKISNNLHKKDYNGMNAFISEYNVEKGYIICMEDSPRKVECDGKSIIVLPVREFLEKLWNGEILI